MYVLSVYNPSIVDIGRVLCLLRELVCVPHAPHELNKADGFVEQIMNQGRVTRERDCHLFFFRQAS